MIKRILRTKIVRNSGIYVLSSTINASVPFFLLPIMTTCLSTEDYGVTAIFQTVLGFMLPIVGLTMDGAIGLEYYIKATNNIGRYIGNCLLISFCSFILCILLVIFLGSYAESLVGLSVKWILLALLQTVFQFICTVCLTLWQVSQKPICYAAFSFGMCLINAFLSVWFVFYAHQGYSGRIYANFFAVCFFAIIAFIYLLKRYNVSFLVDLKMIKDALNYGTPLIPHAIGGWCLSLIDRLFLLNLVGFSAVGKYSVAFQLASVLGFLTLGINQAFVPWLYERLGAVTDAMKRKIVKSTYAIMLLILFSAFLYVLVLPLIQSLFINDKFNGIQNVFVLLLIGYCFQGFYYFFTCYIGYRKKTKYVALITITVMLIKLPLTYILVSFWGMEGAALSFSLTFFFLFLLTAFVSNRVYRMPWFLKISK